MTSLASHTLYILSAKGRGNQTNLFIAGKGGANIEKKFASSK